MIALIVPVMNNFKGLAELMASVDVECLPVIYNNWDRNDGVSVAWNRGIEYATMHGADTFVIINDDVILSPGTIPKMVDGLTKYDLVSAINTRDFQAKENEEYVPHPDFSCFAINKNTCSKYGLFDERIFAYHNDNDYARKIFVRGGSYARREDAPMYHRGSVTQNSVIGRDGGVVSHAAFRASRDYYTAKWGGGVGNETFTIPFNGAPAASEATGL